MTPMFYQIHLSGVDRPGCTMLYQDVYSVRLKFIVTAVRPPKIRIWVQRACLRRCLRIHINSYSFERRESILQDPSFTMAKQSLKTQVTSSDARMRTETGLCFLPSRIQIRNLGKRAASQPCTPCKKFESILCALLDGSSCHTAEILRMSKIAAATSCRRPARFSFT